MEFLGERVSELFTSETKTSTALHESIVGLGDGEPLQVSIESAQSELTPVSFDCSEMQLGHGCE